MSAIGRQYIWEDTKKRSLGSSNNGSDGIIVILKPHFFASLKFGIIALIFDSNIAMQKSRVGPTGTEKDSGFCSKER